MPSTPSFVHKVNLGTRAPVFSYQPGRNPRLESWQHFWVFPRPAQDAWFMIPSSQISYPLRRPSVRSGSKNSQISFVTGSVLFSATQPSSFVQTSLHPSSGSKFPSSHSSSALVYLSPQTESQTLGELALHSQPGAPEGVPLHPVAHPTPSSLPSSHVSLPTTMPSAQTSVQTEGDTVLSVQVHYGAEIEEHPILHPDVPRSSPTSHASCPSTTPFPQIGQSKVIKS